MRFRPLVLVSLVLAAACQQEVAQSTDYRPGEAGTVDHAMCLLGFSAIPLREVSTGHHLVDARINGNAGSFVLDTGANLTVINQASAERFGLSANASGAGGRNAALFGAATGRADQVSVDSFEVGPVSVRQERVVTADLGQLLTLLGTVAGEEVAGVIGQDVLTEHRAIIDVRRRVLYLIEEDEDPAPIVSHHVV